MMTKDAFMALYEKYIAGQCSAEEISLLEAYRDEFELAEGPWDEIAMGNQKQIKRRIRKRLYRQIKRRSSRWHTYAVAAMLLIGLVVFISLYLRTTSINEPSVQQALIQPGSNKALLTLEDGTQVSLNEIDLSLLSGQHQEAIRKLADGLLEYESLAMDAPGQHALQYHTVSTPRGGQFRVTLADGTDVWLNAESSIRFPLAFSGNERVVEVSGEVFFDVEKQAGKQFVVRCEEQTVQVLGTSFVVTSYPNEQVQQTALLEGSVQVQIGAQGYELEPGQRTVYHKRKKHVQKERFEREEALAWKSGYFWFKAEPVESVMRKIARWYDVEVAYQGDMRGKQFTGTMSRFDDIKDVLDMLALTGTVKFHVEGRRVTVME
ncbi:FecR family protein [Parapedobacter deserti]|uniref:FecR family protein n=1 Tax=Parapedobacter deserti TaxID=1912957 RepID=A0ABV7JJZ5_9SPHI